MQQEKQKSRLLIVMLLICAFVIGPLGGISAFLTDKAVLKEQLKTGTWNYSLAVDADGAKNGVWNGKKGVTLFALQEPGMIIDIPDPSAAGYTFKGWTAGSGNKGTFSASTKKYTIAVGSKDSLKAQYAVIPYTITYNLNGGTEPGNPTTYNVETPSFTLKNPTKTGYTFLGWTGANGSTPETAVTIVKGSIGNSTYTANWKPKYFTVHFKNNGGSGIIADEIYQNNETKALTANVFTRTGYTFIGWNTAADGSGTVYTDKQTLTGQAGQELTLYAQWKANTYTVRYSANQGSETTAAPQVFAYTGSVQSYTAPADGLYKLEAWGAQGGGSNGGKGGYSYGTLELSRGDTIYVYVGGQGTMAPTQNNVWGGGGWNGGGQAYATYGGGGMTEISYAGTDYSTTSVEYSTTTKEIPAETKTLPGITYQGRTAGSSSWSSAENKAWTSISSFVAAGTQTVTFYSDDPQATNHTIDPVGRILVNGSVAVQNDDHNGYNFYCSTTVKAGDVVSLEVSSYRTTGATLSSTVINVPARTETTVHISQKDNISVAADSLIMIAGGGGGSTTSTTAAGGAGGGNTGNAPKVEGSINSSLQTTNTTYYKQFAGQSSTMQTYSAGAGAGYYGGRISGNVNGGAAGGTGYISSKLTDAATSLGNTSIPNPTGGTEIGHAGNGYARITNLTTMSDTTATYGQTFTLRTNTFTKAYKWFTGWNTASNGSGTSYTDGQSVQNLTSEQGKVITLYAQWSDPSLILDGNGGTFANKTSLTLQYTRNGNTYTPTPVYAEPTKTGSTFNGWNTKADGTGTAYASKASLDKALDTLLLQWEDSPETLYAQWKSASNAKTTIFHLFPDEP